MIKLRVEHFPQVPCKPFIIPVNTIEEALLLFNVLADYDLFQFDNRIKPDYANMTCLNVWDEEENEWLTWCDGEGYEIENYKLVDDKAILSED